MNIEVSRAPWTDEEVDILNHCQLRTDVHPYTCSKHDAKLVAKREGWICSRPGCSFVQGWARVEVTLEEVE